MVRLKGYFIDYLVESVDPNFEFEVKRLHFSLYEKQAYTDFLKEQADRVVSYGKRFS